MDRGPLSLFTLQWRDRRVRNDDSSSHKMLIPGKMSISKCSCPYEVNPVVHPKHLKEPVDLLKF